MKTFQEYQEFTREVSLFKQKIKNPDFWLMYAAMGLAGEAGEVLEKIKKVLRDDDYVFTDETRAKLHKEMGDTLFYLTVIADLIGKPMSEIAGENRDKLLDRKERGMLGGSGDNR